jgi:hypothetical protein
VLGTEDDSVRFDDVDCLSLSSRRVAVIRVWIDRVDIESKKNHFERTSEEKAPVLMADACMAMDLLISKTNYLWMHRWLVRPGRRRIRTSEVVPDDEAARMDGSNIGETSTSGCE